ncbi:MAG: hypothetical protein NVV59_06935 [Chitinophagaceae bacterium]|nr:hypothetical protein [Chitinophagaceae bacterium]
MKRIYTLMIALLALSVGAWAQTTYYWQPTNGGAWSTANNWRTNPNGTGSTRTSAQNSDILIIDQEVSQTITGVPTQTIGSLRILSGAITLQGTGGTNTLTINNSSTGADLRISAGASLNIASSLENIQFGNNATADISGELVLNNNTYNLNGANVSTTVSSTGVLRNAGTISNSSTAKLIVNGTFVHDREGGTIPTATWNNASVFELNITSNSLPGGLGQSFGHMSVIGNITSNVSLNTSISVAGNFTFATTGNNTVRISNNGTNRTVNVGGNFVQNSGNLTAINNDGNVTLNIGGDYEMNGGNFILKNDEGNGTMNVSGKFTMTAGAVNLRNDNSGSSTVNVTGLFDLQGGTLNMAATSGSSTMNLRGGFSQTGGSITETSSGSGNIVFTGTNLQTFSKSGGSILNAIHVTMNNNSAVDFGTSVLDNTGGNFTMTGNARIITSHNEGLRSNGAAGSIRSNNRTYSSTGDYEFRGASTGNFATAASTVRDLTINNASGEVAMARAFTVSRTLALTNGYVTPGGNELLITTAGTASSVNGAFVNGSLGKAINTGNYSFTFYVGDAASTGLSPACFQIRKRWWRRCLNFYCNFCTW